MKNIRAQTKMINELIRVIARLSYRLDRRNRELRANDEGTSSRCDRDALLRRRSAPTMNSRFENKRTNDESDEASDRVEEIIGPRLTGGVA